MKISRREFVAAGVAGVATLSLGGLTGVTNADASEPQPPDEDGYRLWLRYAPPGNIIKQYHPVLREIRVDGTSATCGVIRDELRSATTAMLGSAVPLNEKGLQSGAVIVGTPQNSALIRDLNWTADLSTAGDDGFIIRSTRVARHPVTVIAPTTKSARCMVCFVSCA